jgi:N-dimethylarginine dimethylaminohydrolase
MSLEARTNPRSKKKGNGVAIEALKERAKKPLSSVATKAPLPKAEPPKAIHLEVDDPIFLMTIPYSYSTSIANNAWMEELDDTKRAVDIDRAMTQFLDLYHFIAGDAVVYILPTPVGCDLQDIVFTANLGAVLEHVPEREIVILSKMATGPRQGEPAIGRKFFEALGFEVYDAPFNFEGEAELKYLRDNIYLGGYGARTDKRVYDWMEDKFDMKIIRLEETDRYCYHLDCSVFPLTDNDTMVCTSLFKRHELEKIAQFTNIIDASADGAYSGICNSVRLHSTIMNASNLHQLKVGTEEYHCELEKNRELEDIAAKLGFEVAYFNLSEYLKGGALLSCMLMHLNRRSNEFSLI